MMTLSLGVVIGDNHCIVSPGFKTEDIRAS